MTLINDFLSLIYPKYCEACDTALFGHENYICNRCLLTLPKSNYHVEENNALARAFAGRVPTEQAFSFFIYQKCGRVQRLLHAIKYQEQKELGQFLGTLYARELKSSKAIGSLDAVVPVPLHKNKLKSRGFNQSEWFAKGLAVDLGLPLITAALERAVETSTQTKKKKYERWENVEGIFKLTNLEAIKGKHILLVDDVITTGATIEAAWQALKEAGNIKISVAGIAFANAEW